MTTSASEAAQAAAELGALGSAVDCLAMLQARVLFEARPLTHDELAEMQNAAALIYNHAKARRAYPARVPATTAALQEAA